MSSSLATKAPSRRRPAKAASPAAQRSATWYDLADPAELPAAPAETVVSVLVPWRAAPDRLAPWAFLRELWAARYPAWQIVEGDSEGAWCKGAAVRDALTRASGSVLVVADADVWCDGVARAVEVVTSGVVAWAIPHYRLLRLTAPATADVLASGGWPTRRTVTTYAERPYPGRPGGGMVVLTRELYERVPIDPRFRGWGQEDESWALALGTLGGLPFRGVDDLWHLWHKPQARLNRKIGSVANDALHGRYVRARTRPERMRTLVAEAS
jgi:hypothetical protein